MDEKTTEAFNELFPLWTLPHERLEWINKQYIDIEIKRMEFWSMVYEIREDMVNADLPVDDTKTLISSASYENGILKILVKDYIPRKCLIKHKGAVTALCKHWLTAIIDAVKRLRETGTVPHFDKRALCIIKTYIPRNIVRDLDNLAFNTILNSLRYSKIIDDDSWNELAFSIDGDVDRENPRTEIYVTEYWDILELVEAKIASMKGVQDKKWVVREGWS